MTKSTLYQKRSQWLVISESWLVWGGKDTLWTSSSMSANGVGVGGRGTAHTEEVRQHGFRVAVFSTLTSISSLWRSKRLNKVSLWVVSKDSPPLAGCWLVWVLPYSHLQSYLGRWSPRKWEAAKKTVQRIMCLVAAGKAACVCSDASKASCVSLNSPTFPDVWTVFRKQFFTKAMVHQQRNR